MAPEDGAWEPNAWLSIEPSGRVKAALTRAEMGQAITTVVAMIVAEELDVPMASVHVDPADPDPGRFGGPLTTKGSASVRVLWDALRDAAAAAREMLILAAAVGWEVSPDECLTAEGSVVHPVSQRSIPYGDLVGSASRMPVPQRPRVRGASRYRHIGRSIPSSATPGIVAGSHLFASDVRVEGMRYAALLRPPHYGARLLGFDGSRAEGLPGVALVARVGDAVAVVAADTWAAQKGRDLVEARWEPGPAAELDTAAIERQWEEASRAHAVRAWEEGDVEAAFAVAARRIDAVYETPFLAPAPMETPGCLASVTRDRCEVWASTQAPSAAREAAAAAAGVGPEKVVLHVMPSGGSFGRGLSPDAIVEGVLVAREAGFPVRVVWSREDDLRHGPLRPGSRHVLSAGLDGEGRVMAWRHRVIAPSIGGQAGRVPEGSLDETATSGARGMPYAIPNIWVDFVMSNTPVPIGCMRTGYEAQAAFANECFLDEIARALGEGPLSIRRRLLRGSPRHLGVVDLAAEKAGWNDPALPGRHRGIAVHASAGSYAASVVEISVAPAGKIHVHRVVSALDCGRAVNPDGVKAQIEGGAIFALSAALTGAITIRGGAVVEGGFGDYPVMRMDEAPVVEAHIVESPWGPTGAGEPPVAPVAPALANALFAATGVPIRRLPLRPVSRASG